MTRLRKHRWAIFVVLLAILACAGSWAAGRIRSTQDRAKVAKMTEKKKTVCIGRFLVDVPADANVSVSGEVMQGFDIETIEESESAFRDRVAAREAEIEQRGANAKAGEPGGMVEALDVHADDKVGRILVHGADRTYGIENGRRVDVEWVSVEAHAHIAGLSFSLSKKIADAAEAREAEALLSRLQPRGDDETPATPGFCIRHAVFAEPQSSHKYGRIVMRIGLPDHSDLSMVFVSLPGGTRDHGLLGRVAENDASAGADEMLRVTKLREARRSINGIDGEEVLERVREFNFTTSFGFLWEAQGVSDDPLQPFLSLELHAGISPRPGAKPVDASLHEDAVLALWDSISSSIRLRKSGSSSVPAVPPAMQHPGAVLPRAAERSQVQTSQPLDIRRLDHHEAFDAEAIVRLDRRSFVELM